MLKYVLTYEDDSVTLTGSDCPANVDDFTLTFTRHETYHSVLRYYTISERLHTEAKQFIDNLVSEYGWNISIRIDVYMWNSATYSWLQIIENGVVGLSNITQSELFTDVNFEDGSFESKVMNRESVEINFNNTTDLDGRGITSTETPDTITLRGVSDSTQITAIRPIYVLQKILRCITGVENPVEQSLSTILNTGELSTVMLANGRMIRNFSIDDIPVPFTLNEFFTSFDALGCLGMGFYRNNGVTKAYIDSRDIFYPQTLTATIETISELEYSFSSELLYNELIIGYNNFEKKANEYGQTEYNIKANYTTPFYHFKNTKNITSEYRADGISIDNLRQLSQDDGSSDTLDDEIFLIDCYADDDGNLYSRQQEGFSQVSGIYNEYNLYTNLKLTPARLIKNHRKFLSVPYRYEKTKYLTYNNSGTLSKVNTQLNEEENNVVDCENILASDIGDSYLSGRIVKFNCTFNATIINDINNNPNGLIKFYDYIAKSYNFGYIKEVSISPVDRSHNVELYEALNVPDIEEIGYLLKEDGSPLLLEDGSLIKLEVNMPQVPTKISSLTPKLSVDDDDVFVVANNGLNYQVTGAVIKAAVAAETDIIETYTLNADEEKIINLGAYDENKMYVVNYQTERDTRFRAGTLLIKAYSPTSATVSESGLLVIPTDFDQTGGISLIDADVDSNQVRLKITTDDGDANQTSLIMTKKAL